MTQSIDRKITLRNVFKFPKTTMEPAIDPSTGRYAPHVKRVNSNGDMVLNDADRNYDGILIAENESIELYDGKVFDLDDPFDEAWWDAIKFSKRIAQDRWLKNAKGEYIIDGNAMRYGTAEFYVEHKGQQSKTKVNSRKEKNEAEQFIFADSPDGLFQIARLLGNPMTGLSISDVQEYLLDVANSDPSKIKSLYTGEDTHLRILLLDALDAKVIRYKDKLYQYGDNTLLGTTQESTILWFKMPNNKRLLDMIKQEVYPEEYGIIEVEPDYEAELVEDSNGKKLKLSKPAK